MQTVASDELKRTTMDFTVFVQTQFWALVLCHPKLAESPHFYKFSITSQQILLVSFKLAVQVLLYEKQVVLGMTFKW